MSIGYACINLSLSDANFKTCRKDYATNQRLQDLIDYNLDSLRKILEYNANNDIKLFRISSDLIPFGSSPVNKLLWWDIFKYRFDELAELIKKTGQRVSMHPGQYTVLNSPNENVAARAIEDLEYHCRVLDFLNTGKQSKIILHVGGVYDNKPESIKRFIDKYQTLSIRIKERLVIENDDRSYSISDVLKIHEMTGIPVVFDNLHHYIHKPETGDEYSQFHWISKAKETWQKVDGNQKIHYSQQDKLKRPGSHSQTISVDEFAEFYEALPASKPDIMLEVKDKNISALKCIGFVNLHN